MPLNLLKELIMKGIKLVNSFMAEMPAFFPQLAVTIIISIAIAVIPLRQWLVGLQTARTQDNSLGFPTILTLQHILLLAIMFIMASGG